MTDEQARALHEAIQTRDRAWQNFDSAARQPRDAGNSWNAQPGEAADAWIAADAAVWELMLAPGFEPIEVRDGDGHVMTIPPARDPGKPEGKRRGRPPKVQPRQSATAVADAMRRAAAGDTVTP